MDTYLDTWPMKPTCIAARTRLSIAGLRSFGRDKSIALPLQIIDSVGRIEFLVWTGLQSGRYGHLFGRLIRRNDAVPGARTPIQ